MRIAYLLILSILWIAPVQAYEGAGLLSKDLNGALPKDLWDDQDRSKIIKAMRELPDNSPLKSVQDIKRNLLISSYDVDDIDNDVPADDQNNLLTVRLEKLAEMGFWKDALKLYNSAVENPEDNEEQAKIGVTLTLLEKGLSTACLDVKVLRTHFSGDFWDRINTICNAELYEKEPASDQFEDSTVLKALYFEPNFKIPADNISSLQKMGLLELAMVFAKNRVDYKGADFEKISQNTPLKIRNLYLKDPEAPDSLKENLAEKSIEPAFINEEKVTQSDILNYIISKLRRNKRIDESDIQLLSDFGELYPENYFFIAILDATRTKYGNIVIPKDKINLGAEKLMGKYGNKVKLLHSVLDKGSEFSNNRVTAYEKQIGILLLSELGKLSDPFSDDPKNMGNTGDKSLEKENMPLKRLRNVGLIQQTHLVAREILADLMQSQL